MVILMHQALFVLLVAHTVLKSTVVHINELPQQIDNEVQSGWNIDQDCQLHSLINLSRFRYFVHDALDEMRQHGVERHLNDDFLQLIRDDLIAVNPYARELRQLGLENRTEIGDEEKDEDDDVLGRRERDPPIAIRLTAMTNSREVAAVIVRGNSAQGGPVTGSSIMIHMHSSESPAYLEANNPLRDPLAYPLLFPYGDLGWGTGQQYNCDLVEFLRYRLLMPEQGLEVVTQTDQRITANRFQLLSRIAQVYLVDTTSRVEDIRLDYIRAHQNRFLQADEEDDNNHNEGDDRPNRTFLPASYTGSVRHLKKLAANALALVAARGKPSLFITLTCNPKWPEIERELLDGQTAFDRPDITCRVFHAKLEIILKLIRQGDIFGPNHSVGYEMRVIEFQFRGLPHAHVVLRLSGLPDDTDARGMADWIDTHISATMPAAVHGDRDTHALVREVHH